MKVVYQGQIGAAVGLSEEDREVFQGETVAEFIARLSRDKPERVAKFLITEEGTVRSSLFVAVDGTHLTDLHGGLAEAGELLLMPPMAGG